MGRKGRGERGGFHITFLIHKRVRNWFTGHISMTLGFGGTRLDGAFGRTRRNGNRERGTKKGNEEGEQRKGTEKREPKGTEKGKRRNGERGGI